MHGVLREGTPVDVRELVRLHAKCSTTSIQERFLTPLPILEARLAARLLNPTGGFSYVVERSGELAGVVTVTPLIAAHQLTDLAPDPTVADLGLLVADCWHRQGIGTRLLLEAVRRSSRAGFGALELSCRPGNNAVLRLVTHAGLRARVCMRDGLSSITIPLLAAPARGVVRDARRSLSPDNSSG